jgi:hypothetical protein
MSSVKVPTCSRCESTDPQKWVWVQYVRVNYPGVRLTDTAVEVKTDGEIEYESVIQEHLRCKCGGEIEMGNRSIVYV